LADDSLARYRLSVSFGGIVNTVGGAVYAMLDDDDDGVAFNVPFDGISEDITGPLVVVAPIVTVPNDDNGGDWILKSWDFCVPVLKVKRM